MRLVATDLDGTLVRSDGSVSDTAVRALRRAVAAGIVVVFVTGRPPRFVDRVVARTGVAEPVICANGALVWDTENSAPLLVRGFDPDVVRAVVARVRHAVPGAAFAVEQVPGLTHEPAFVPRGADPGYRRGELDGVLDTPVLKLLVRGPDADVAVLRSVVSRVVGDSAEVTWSSTYAEPLLELSAAGVHKGSALAALAGRLGIGAPDVVAFGDMPNDVAMLRWAGTGVAVANADPEVLAVADLVAATNDEDGVARTLTDLLDAAGTHVPSGHAPSGASHS